MNLNGVAKVIVSRSSHILWLVRIDFSIAIFNNERKLNSFSVGSS